MEENLFDEFIFRAWLMLRRGLEKMNLSWRGREEYQEQALLLETFELMFVIIKY